MSRYRRANAFSRRSYDPPLQRGWYVFHRGFAPWSGPHKTEAEAKKEERDALHSGLDVYVGRVS